MEKGLGGYRASEQGTCTAATHNLDFDKIDQGHRVYVERVTVESDRANADCEIVIVSAGQEFPVVDKENVTASWSHGLEGKFWLYSNEFLRFKWAGLTSGDKIYAWAVGVDKWEVEGG